ncbi:MAG: hypothetical protein ACE5HU_08295, partial [Acidobacteriota bacterium]
MLLEALAKFRIAPSDAVMGIELMRRAVDLFWDPEEGGFLDTVPDPGAFGYLSRKRRLNDDTGYPALNAVAALTLDRLWLHTGDAAYHDRAEECLKLLISATDKVDHRHGGLGLAIDAHLRRPTRYVVIGEDDSARVGSLADAAWKVFDPGKLVIHLRPGRDDERIAALETEPPEGAHLLVCAGAKCSSATTTVEGIDSLSVPR